MMIHQWTVQWRWNYCSNSFDLLSPPLVPWHGQKLDRKPARRKHACFRLPWTLAGLDNDTVQALLLLDTFHSIGGAVLPPFAPPLVPWRRQKLDRKPARRKHACFRLPWTAASLDNDTLQALLLFDTFHSIGGAVLPMVSRYQHYGLGAAELPPRREPWVGIAPASTTIIFYCVLW